MNIKYFGQYLLEKGYVTREHLLEGIKHQKNVNIKLGTLVVDLEYMSAKQVEEVLEVQKRENKQFGIIAVEKNYLTNEQVEELLAKQKEERVYLGEALVEKGFMNLEDLEKYLKEYHQEQRSADKDISLAIDNLDPRFSDFVKDSIQITQNMIVRLLDDNGKVSGCARSQSDKSSSGYMVYQKVFGEKNFIIALSLEEKELLKFSSKLLKQKFDEIDELAEDGVKEFLNIIIGHICVGLSNKGVKTETSPPICMPVEQFSSELVYSSLAVISILLLEGSFDIHFYLI